MTELPPPLRPRVEVLRELSITRADGGVVPVTRWRTGKTMDLLRMLALDAGRPLRTALLVERLWPQVDHERALASLRTAASEIRTTLRARNCVVRHHGSLTLIGVEVDARDLLLCASEARRARVEGRPAAALRQAQRAATIYQDDFHAYDDEASWAVIERERLSRVHGALLLDGAECALELDRFQEAHDLAADLVRADPMGERGHRVLMRSLGELGEMGRALRAFESYRRYLADELGVDPSSQTRDLHGWLLRLSSEPQPPRLAR